MRKCNIVRKSMVEGTVTNVFMKDRGAGVVLSPHIAVGVSTRQTHRKIHKSCNYLESI